MNNYTGTFILMGLIVSLIMWIVIIFTYPTKPLWPIERKWWAEEMRGYAIKLLLLFYVPWACVSIISIVMEK